MTDDQWLRDALGAAVPDPPSAPDRAASARRRARTARRRTAAAVATGAALALAAVAVPLALGGSGSPTPAPQVPTHPTSVPAAVKCPQADTEPTGPGTLPEGAVAVRLCDGPGLGFDEPDDALVTDVDDLVRVVNDQEVTGPRRACRSDLGRGYLLAFSYPDGTVRLVTGELYGCHQLTVGSTVRAEPERPWERFIELLRDQRATLEPPATTGASPTCSSPDLSPVARPADMDTAVLCARYETDGRTVPRAVAVPPADLRVLLADREERDDRRAPPKGCAQQADLELVGTTVWGDTTAAHLWCGMWSDEQGGYWGVGAPAERILDRLVREAGTPVTTVDADSSAEDVLAAYVDLLDAGDRKAAAALWHPMAGRPELPALYSHIDYQVEGVRELRFVSAWQDATAVQALYRERIRDAYVPYREAVFMLGRDEQGVFRIVSMQLGDAVETGR